LLPLPLPLVRLGRQVRVRVQQSELVVLAWVALGLG